MPDSADKWDDTLTHAVGSPEVSGATDKLQLIVSVEGEFTTHRLPASGAVTIGRAAGNFVRIEHPSISRSHAVLSIGTTLRVLDLESSNGTRVAGHRIEPNTPVEVAAGDAVELGGVMVMIQRVTAALPPRRILSHDYFEARVEEECARRARAGGSFCVVRINAPPDAVPADVEASFQETLRAHDVLALYAPNEYEILLDAAPDDAREVVERLKARLARYAITARSGSASYPLDGATAGALIAHANAAVRGTEPPPPAEDDEPQSVMDGLRALVEQIAASTISVLILGETGVGKEVQAETLHRLSPRTGKTFLRLNCAALSETLLESELFGHERGAFTGAVAQKRGLLETADGGTVFLDEVGELPLTTQVKLLRVIEERKVMRVGGLQARDIDVRFVSATNRDLEAEIARGTFRQDLFFRLNGVTVVVPPLRERPTEIEKLSHVFIAQATRDRPRPPTLTQDALALLRSYSWPGNIRELRNVIERAVLLCGAGPISARHLPVEKMTATIAARAPSRVPSSGKIPSAPPPSQSFLHGTALAPFDNATDAWPIMRESSPPTMNNLKVELEAVERQRILDALERCAWNQTKAAQMLGIARGTLVSRLDQYGIARPRKGNA
jgi:DNA-binding NtrC family response regulator